MIWLISIVCFLVVFTYAIFPLWTIAKGGEKQIFTPKESFNGRVFLIMAAHNEALVLNQKMEAIWQNNFNENQLICFVGSDASTDETVAILNSYKSKLNLEVFDFKERQGKPNLVNRLVEHIHQNFDIQSDDLFLLTDANVIFHPDCIHELSKHFVQEHIGLVDSNIVNTSSTSAIGENEQQYLQYETRLKIAEGNLWQCAMGPFGGAYMIRAQQYTPVPKNFMVDDFFIFYNVLLQGKQTILNPKAVCYENVSDSFAEEFRRKERISIGNFQNLAHFFPANLNLNKRYNLVFVAHKLLRWIAPILVAITTILASAAAIFDVSNGSSISVNSVFVGIMICLLLGIPILNSIFKRLNLRLKSVTALSYFILMNIALLFGFFKYIKGVRSNVWKPTKRKL